MKKQQHYIVKPKIELGNKAGIQVWFVAISIAILTFVILSPSLKCGFTNFDEEQFVIQNPLIVSKSIELKKIFTSIVGANDYYPITIISFACNYQIGKLKPFGYHFLNVLFHTLNTFFVFIFIFIISKRNLLIAAIVALFFGIHPMHVESVTWITERKDVLFMFFFLTGLITYLIYREKRKMVWIILTIFLFVFSCLSKGTAVVFPAILILIDYLLEAKLNKKMFIVKIPFFLLSLAFIILTFLLHNNESLQFKMEHKTLLHRFIFASYDLLWYLYKFIIPNNLSAYYAYPNENAIPLSYWISPVLLLGGLIISYIYLRKVKPIVFGLLFYFFSIILMLQIIPTGSGNFNMADRYSYLSFIGLLFVIAYLLNRVWQKKTKFRYIIMVIVGIYSVIFCYSTFARTKVWQNSETLWTDVISKNPDRCYLAYYNRGHYYQFEKNDLEKALSDYNKTIELYSSSAEAFNNRGLIYFYKGRIDLALID